MRTERLAIPAIDRLLRTSEAHELATRHGREPVAEALREATNAVRTQLFADALDNTPEAVIAAILKETGALLARSAKPSLRPVFNLTGTVLHTNLGRAPLSKEAVSALSRVGAQACNLEFDLDAGKRGDRDSHVEALLAALCGAEAATVVNNNAAAVMLVLSTLALRREVLVARGELVEIGGAFRIPDVMTSAGARLREVGTTNRVHRRDFTEAIHPARSALVMKVHPSNYRIEGFTASVPEPELAALAHEHQLPFVVDLGSGTLLDFARFGLPHEPTVQETLGHGADLVTFSGDKLLGGPQAGLIAGRRDLIARLKKNPLMRALRVDRLTLAALEATLRLYSDPERARQEIPALRLLTRPLEEITALALRALPMVAIALSNIATVTVEDCASQIGSGALPVDLLPSKALVITPLDAAQDGASVERLAARFRHLPVPVVGRIHHGALWLDLRCLEEEAAFLAQLGALPAA